MKISVVTANFNYGRFLPKAVRSVWEQLDGNESLEIEHIVIDGGSTDGSVDFLHQWESDHVPQPPTPNPQPPYTFRWVSEPDEGQTDAINKGLRMATGDIVCWLNADEYYLPGKLAKVAEAFQKYPKADFLYGEPLYMDAEDKPIRIKRDHPFSKFVLLHYGCVIPSCCSFWRRKVLDAGHYLDPSYKVIMDGEYYCRLVRAGYRFRYLPTTVAAFLWHGGNVSTTFEEKRLEENAKIKTLYSGVPPRHFKPYRNAALALRRALVLFRLAFLPKESIAQATSEP